MKTNLKNKIKKTITAITAGVLVFSGIVSFTAVQKAEAESYYTGPFSDTSFDSYRDSVSDSFNRNVERAIQDAIDDTLNRMGLSTGGPTGSLQEGLEEVEGTLDEQITQHSSFRQYVIDVLNFFLTFLGLLAVAIIIFAGFRYVTASGNQEQADTAKKTITYAVIGLFVVLASFAIVNTIINFTEGDPGSGGGTGATPTTTGGRGGLPTDSNLSRGSDYFGTGSGSNNALGDLTYLFRLMAPVQRLGFESYGNIQQGVVPDIQKLIQDGEDYVNNLPADAVSERNKINGVINDLRTKKNYFENTSLEDYMDYSPDGSLSTILENAKELKSKLSEVNANVPSLDQFIVQAEGILYGYSSGAFAEEPVGKIGAPIARLLFFNVGADGADKFKIRFSADNSTAGMPSGNIVSHEIDFDINNDTDGDGNPRNDFINMPAGVVEHSYIKRAEPYSAMAKVVDNTGTSDTVVRSFRITEDGAVATDDGNQEGSNPIARLRISNDSTSENKLALVFDASSSASASGSSINYFYIDTDLSKDEDGDGNPTNDENLSGTDLSSKRYTYTESGSYRIKLLVRDSIGNQDAVIKRIEISETEGLIDIISENKETESSMEGKERITGTELLDYVRYGYNLRNYSIDMRSIRDALDHWYETSVPHTPEVTAAYNEVSFDIDRILKVNPEDNTQVNNLMQRLTNSIKNLLNTVESIQSIQAVVTAQPGTRGKAPFTVEFSAVDSSSPEGLDVEISPEGYCWSGLNTNAEKGITRSPENPLNGPVQTVTFTKPGSYRVGLSIPASGSCDGPSSDIGANYISGNAALEVNVLPPSSDIKVTMTPPCRGDYSGSDTWGEGYNPSGVTQLNNGQSCYLSMAEARNGVSFDPSQTKPSAGRVVESLTWFIGSDRFGPYTSPEGARVTYTGFSTAGTYRLTLNTEDSTGEKDSFRADIHIVEVVADIAYTPLMGKVGTEFEFSAAGSQADNANITEFNWTITNLDTGIDAYSSEEKVFKQVIDTAGKYNVTLRVTDSQGRTASASEVFEVASEEPVAFFKAEQINPSYPATYRFDARDSYDLDSKQPIKCKWFIDGMETSITGGNGDCSVIIDGRSRVPEEEPNIAAYIGTGTTSSSESDEEYLPESQIIQKAIGIFDYTFSSAGAHDVTLQITGSGGETDTYSQFIEVPSTLAVDFDSKLEGENTTVTRVGKETTFVANSPQATSYDWDYGDGKKDSTTENTITHTYNEAGEYRVKLTAYDDLGNSNSITKKVRVSKADRVVAEYDVKLGGNIINEQVEDCGPDTKEIYRWQTLNFNASDSINKDGTNKNLEYSWDFGDGIYAEGVSVNHKYDEISRTNECFNVLLTVRDKDDPSAYSTEDFANIKVVNSAPKVSALRIETSKEEMVTPMTVNLSAIGSRDADPTGRITKYRWWYYLEGDKTKRGLHETARDYTDMSLQPLGAQGETKKYYFALEVEDNEGGKTRSKQSMGEDPSLEVITGHNVPSRAHFTVDKVRADVGEPINFSANMTNEYGEVIPKDAYRWDFEGDGRYDDTSSGAFVSHSYETGGKYTPRLKIVHRELSSTYDMPVYINPNTNAPTPAFIFYKEGNEVTFVNNSHSDPNIADDTLYYAWDFDHLFDSDGDGNLTNDVDSELINPVHYFKEKRLYKVTLKVTDAYGVSSSITRPVDLSPSVPVSTSTSTPASTSTPTSTSKNSNTGTLLDPFGNPVDTASSTSDLATSADIKAPEVLAVQNTVPAPHKLTGDVYLPDDREEIMVDLEFDKSIGDIVEYRVDKNIYFDTDGDGDPENDVDNRDHPSFTTGETWTTNYSPSWAPVAPRLTVVDSKGQTSSATRRFYFESAEEIESGKVIPEDTKTELDEDIPAVIFSYSPDYIFAGSEVSFEVTEATGEVNRFIWDFDGDNAVDLDTNETRANYTYDQIGEYKVTLLGITKDGRSAEYTQILEIRSPVKAPKAEFEYNTDGKEVHFYNQSTVDDAIRFHQPEYEWKFYENPTSEWQDGVEKEYTSDSNVNVSHIFEKPGTYQVELKVTDYYGNTNKIEKEITLEEESPAPIIEEEEEIDEPEQPATPATPTQPTETETEGFSILGFILNIVKWLIVFVIFVILIGLIIAFFVFKKKYPKQSFTGFISYLALTLKGEEYSPEDSPEKKEKSTPAGMMNIKKQEEPITPKENNLKQEIQRKQSAPAPQMRAPIKKEETEKEFIPTKNDNTLTNKEEKIPEKTQAPKPENQVNQSFTKQPEQTLKQPVPQKIDLSKPAEKTITKSEIKKSDQDLPKENQEPQSPEEKKQKVEQELNQNLKQAKPEKTPDWLQKGVQQNNNQTQNNQTPIDENPKN